MRSRILLLGGAATAAAGGSPLALASMGALRWHVSLFPNRLFHTVETARTWQASNLWGFVCNGPSLCGLQSVIQCPLLFDQVSFLLAFLCACVCVCALL